MGRIINYALPHSRHSTRLLLPGVPWGHHVKTEAESVKGKRESGRAAKRNQKEAKKGWYSEMIYKRDQHWHMDVTINGVRYREALNTTDWREAQRLEKKRLAEIQGGKGASKSGREFGRKTFRDAVETFLQDRVGHVAERTIQFEKE